MHGTLGRRWANWCDGRRMWGDLADGEKDELSLVGEGDADFRPGLSSGDGDREDDADDADNRLRTLVCCEWSTI